jgi:hypothetical protein
MFKLLVLRASIALWKRTISISDLLKPTTWKTLAIVQAMLAVAFFGLYLAPVASEHEIPPVHITHVRPPVPLKVVAPKISLIDAEVLTASKDQRGNLSINGSSFDLAGSSHIEFWEYSSDANIANWASMDAGSVQFVMAHSLPRENRYLSSGVANPSNLSDSSLPKPSISADKPPVVIQTPPPPQLSLLQTIQAVVLLFQGVFMAIGSIFASVFAWVGYHRGKADLLLKQLQVRELQLKVEKMERDRELQEAATSAIILCS